jgi:3-deoxy-manno-octulosonate cytidylyltransferase (CMP-KDO synthetase)
VVVVPARLESSRFPRKVLARETGKYLIQHVWEGVQGVPGVSAVIVATDSAEVLEAVKSFGAEAWLTSSAHLSGTDRVAEVARELRAAIVVNVQGDEPRIRKEDVARVIALFEEGGEEAVMTTLAVRRDDPEGQLDPNQVKVVCDARGRALYFSRAPIPVRRVFPPRPRAFPLGPPGEVRGGVGDLSPEGASRAPWSWLHHVGIYGYRREFLFEFAAMKPGRLEAIERLEQLRALENGYRIQVGITGNRYGGIDTEEEYREFVRECRGGHPGGGGR